MRLIRSLVYYVTLTLATITFGLTVVFAALFRVERRNGGIHDWASLMWARSLLRVAGTPVRTVGLEHVPRREPYVLISNHQSWFDILALMSVLPHLRFVAKIEMARIPVLGTAMRAAGHLFIDRGSRQQAFELYKGVAQQVKDGACAVVFPEGTRSRTGRMQPFKKGPFVLATSAQVPLVPAYCANTFQILPKGHFRLRPRPITIYFGEPIPTAGCDYEDRQTLLALGEAAIHALRARSEDGRVDVAAPEARAAMDA